jgi:enamine deaminase RidA (YjgF/YER057c/UK114 family)
MTKLIREDHSHGASRVRVNAITVADEFVFTSAQTALDGSGRLLCSGVDQELPCALDQLKATLRQANVSFPEVTKLGLYYLQRQDSDENTLLRQIRQRLSGAIPPTITAIPLSVMPYPGIHVQLDAIAMRGSAGKRSAPSPSDLQPWPEGAEFSHAVRCGNVVFVGGQMAINHEGIIQRPRDIVGQAEYTIENMRAALKSVGADLDAVVKLNTFYVGSGTIKDWEVAAQVRSAAFTKSGPAATGVAVPGPYPGGVLLRQDSIAILQSGDRPAPRSTSWPKHHWDWPMKVSFEHGVKLGRVAMIGGQIARSPSGETLHVGNLARQAACCMDYIQRILAGFNASTDDIAKITIFYVSRTAPKDLQDVLSVLAGYFRGPLPAVTAVSLEKLNMEDVLIEIEGIAFINGR